MGPKTRLPKHVREYLRSTEYQILRVENPESALTEMTMLMYYFMEKYEKRQKNV